MNNKLELVKSSKFGNVECDIYSNEKEMFMTISQLAHCLGYASKSGVEKILQRNDYLRENDFSSICTLAVGGTDKMGAPQTMQKTRVFTEDGIYEVTMLAKTEKAKEFRAFIRKLLKSLRKGENKLIKASEYQKLTAEAKLNNSRARMASILMKLADKTDIKEYKQVCCSYASTIIAGKPLLPLPEINKKTYSATDIANILGVTANKIGILANRNNLKTKQYGKMFYDKSRYSNKEVETFRYYDEAIPKFKELLSL